jgi:YHS domain-containing protein
MFRLIFYLLLLVMAISILRSVLAVLGRAFTLFMQGPGRQQQGPRQQVPLTGELKRDPVCGTFVAASSSVKHTDGGNTVHFCSAECRDKYLLAARH